MTQFENNKIKITTYEIIKKLSKIDFTTLSHVIPSFSGQQVQLRR